MRSSMRFLTMGMSGLKRPVKTVTTSDMSWLCASSLRALLDWSALSF